MCKVYILTQTKYSSIILNCKMVILKNLAENMLNCKTFFAKLLIIRKLLPYNYFLQLMITMSNGCIYFR